MFCFFCNSQRLEEKKLNEGQIYYENRSIKLFFFSYQTFAENNFLVIETRLMQLPTYEQLESPKMTRPIIQYMYTG